MPCRANGIAVQRVQKRKPAKIRVGGDVLDNFQPHLASGAADILFVNRYQPVRLEDTLQNYTPRAHQAARVVEVLPLEALSVYRDPSFLASDVGEASAVQGIAGEQAAGPQMRADTTEQAREFSGLLKVVNGIASADGRVESLYQPEVPKVPREVTDVVARGA
jgi:hypothetical protein